MSTENVVTEPAPVAAKPGGVLYVLQPNGSITRHDTKIPNGKPVGIAAVRDGVVRWSHKDFTGYQIQVAGLLKREKIAAKFEPYVERAPVMREATLVRDFSTDGDVREPLPSFEKLNEANEVLNSASSPSDGPDGMRNLTVEQRKAVNYLRSKEGFPLGELERPMPPAPHKTSGAGDKTPAYVRWLLRYQPAKFCEAYGVSKIGAIEVTVPGKLDPVTHVKKPATRRWEEGHVLARRATIFTDKIVSRQQTEGDE